MGGKKSDAEKLNRLVSFRLTDADHSAYLQKVEASGLKSSAFFRDAVLENKTQVIARAKAGPERRRLLYLMNKASNNINQLAYRVNADHLTDRISEATYTRILSELGAIVRYMRTAVNDVD